MQTEQETTSRSKFPDSCSYPLIAFVHGKSKKKSQTLYSLSRKRPYVRSIRELRNACYCWPLAHGGLVFWDPDSKKQFLLNTATMAKVELPELKWPFSGTCRYVVSSPPGDQNCMVLCTDLQIRQLFFCRPGGDHWIKHEYDIVNDCLQDIVGCHGRFYARSLQEIFISIEFDPHPMLRVLSEDCLKHPVGMYYFRPYLLESCGEVFRVNLYLGTSETVGHVTVCKFNFMKEKWERVESIGGEQTFFLGPDGFAASRSVSELGEEGNCIYFLKSRDRRLYTFEMAEGTISTTLPCPNLPTPWSTPFWIMPQSDV